MPPHSHQPTTEQQMANAIRALTIDAVEQSKSGHPGMPMGMADIAWVLFSRHLKFLAKEPNWPNRDRFILSNGHGSMLLYALLYLTGYQDIDLEQIKRFRQLHAKTAGHPEYGYAAGIETTTGPLGQGIANAVGMAIAQSQLEVEFGHELIDHYTYVFCGDGCLMEGISHEALSLAGHLRLHKLIVIFDDNSISIDGNTNLSTSDDTTARLQSYGWFTTTCDGHDVNDIDRAIDEAKQSSTPAFISAKTIIGYGSPNKAGSAKAHGSPLGEKEAQNSKQQLGWDHPPFHIPSDILEAWRKVGTRHEQTYQQWQAQGQSSNKYNQLQQRLESTVDIKEINHATSHLQADNLPTEATRIASLHVIKQLEPQLPALIGGSADLTGSNMTLANQTPISPQGNLGKYIYYGVREHAMAAIMNGLSLNGGFIPYGGTFLCFSDYSKPAIRLSALMQICTIHIMTHDSIGLGEDGPTHQPIEHLSALRAIPNTLVIRPADAVETAHAWQIALQHKGPSILALSRQNLAPLPHWNEKNIHSANNSTALGIYETISSPEAKINLLASGSEVNLCIKAAEILANEQIAVNVFSMPCAALYQPQEQHSAAILQNSNLALLIIEAAQRQSLTDLAYKLKRTDAHIISIDEFGLSGPAEQISEHFGFTPNSLATKVKQILTCT